ncbi:MAG TPA: STAS domain-containing protein [Anaerolineales bacterium]|jgi:hypothetical protein|nr:STAS domain-containing protein [Anaerolineales bacterium]
MEINVSQEQARVPVTVFRLKGELTSDVELQTAAQEAFEAGTRNILLDLKNVPYMSSAGLRAIHNIFMMLRGDAPAESDKAMTAGIAAGTFTSPHLKLLNPTQHVHEVLKTAGYDMFLEIHRDYKKAIASF